MRRLILVYNPRSARYARVQKEVLDPARKLKGWMVGKYIVRASHVDDNADRLARILQPGDLVLAAGGDATASIAVNAVMRANQTLFARSFGSDFSQAGLAKLDLRQVVKLAVLGYGNFNDCANALASFSFDGIIALSGQPELVWPLDVYVNQKHWRYAFNYFGLGLLAEACAVFDQPKVRAKLKKGFRTLHSFFALFSWWLKAPRDTFLPSFRLAFADRSTTLSVSDFLVINSPRVARCLKGHAHLSQKQHFTVATFSLARFFSALSFSLRAFLRPIPGAKVTATQLSFFRPATVMLQAEGEYEKKTQVSQVFVKKAAFPLPVINFRAKK